MFSVLVLTGNEEINIRACLESVSWCDDVWVLDCGSTDRTVEIAKEMGANVITRPFDDFGSQRNYGMDTCKWKHEWVFDLDADERFTPELREECEELVRRDEKSAYFVANKMMLMGKWIKHASQFPVYQMRFHKLGECRFVSYGHGQREGETPRGIGYMKNAYIHYNFSKGLGNWFEKHVGYAIAEAKQQLADEERGAAVSGEGNVALRRRLKRLASKLPGRSWLKLFYLLFARGGILDGPAGWLYCRMQAHYEFMCSVVLKDLRKSSARGSGKQNLA